MFSRSCSEKLLAMTSPPNDPKFCFGHRYIIMLIIQCQHAAYIFYIVCGVHFLYRIQHTFFLYRIHGVHFGGSVFIRAKKDLLQIHKAGLSYLFLIHNRLIRLHISAPVLFIVPDQNLRTFRHDTLIPRLLLFREIAAHNDLTI